MDFILQASQGFEYLQNLVRQSSTTKINNEDSENLQMKLNLSYSNLKVKIGALYGNVVILKLFRKSFPLSDLLLLGYDDIWLSQLITIGERAILIKNQKNFTTIFLGLLNRDRDLRIKYDAIINSECGETELDTIVSYLLNKYAPVFKDKILPAGENKAVY